MCEKLKEDGILLGKILYPTVAKNLPRIRISITTSQTKDDIDLLCASLKKQVLTN